MTVTKFLDKTLEAAKKSALQMAEGDYSKLKSIMPDDEDRRKNKHSMNSQPKKTNADSEESVSAAEDHNPAVVFERSTSDRPDNDKDTTNNRNGRHLKFIRKYAAQQTDNNNDAETRVDSGSEAKPAAPKNGLAQGDSSSATQFYSRKAIPKKQPTTGPVHASEKETTSNGVSKGSLNPETPEERKTDDSKEVHKRLDRLESLMHLALSATDEDLVSHPLFHRLVHKGVSKRLARNWFKELVTKGIDPDQQAKLFSAKLLQLIDELLQESQAEAPAEIMLFTGRAGAGKTHMITKLLNSPNFLEDQKKAVASFNPDGKYFVANYSILEPFCSDHNIDFYSLHTIDQVEKLRGEWGTYDHLLIDTPALDMGGASLTEAINLLKKELAKQYSYETHYLVNTAVNGTAFNDPLAQAINADHVALTHIDQSLKWGKAVQLLTNSEYKLRYLSSGPSMTGDLLPFVPLKFARKLLRA